MSAHPALEVEQSELQPRAVFCTAVCNKGPRLVLWALCAVTEKRIKDWVVGPRGVSSACSLQSRRATCNLAQTGDACLLLSLGSSPSCGLRFPVFHLPIFFFKFFPSLPISNTFHVSSLSLNTCHAPSKDPFLGWVLMIPSRIDNTWFWHLEFGGLSVL